MRTAAEVEHLLAERVGLALLRVAHRHVHLHALGLRRDVGDERLHVRLAVGRSERIALRVLGREALLRDHAMHEPRLEVHHAIGVREVTRQLRVGALDDARAHARGRIARTKPSSARAAASTGPRRALPKARPDCRPATPGGTSRSRRRRSARRPIGAHNVAANAAIATRFARILRFSSKLRRDDGVAPDDESSLAAPVLTVAGRRSLP